ncbi:hypothetical protein [Parendozoicomonas haliclonae]|uniref:Uncharacterized protein n=1 Tax=Parendozoicomonas haliclonae TaxID=1960125 RepID=A0A1X7AL03_9GAMM|nr:hypothetical protein [Parendozoicomonas haliclonae]SMA47584.1 hypothetical protein EHSB41UT_02480 [Parendozoicomonas haliclonae]
MKNSNINSWIELKKMTPHYEVLMNYKRMLNRSTPWTDMSQFFKEADKHMK